MSDMRIIGPGNSQELSLLAPKQNDSSKGFSEIMQDAMGKIEQVQQDADAAVKQMSSGGDITNAIIAMEKADMSFQLMIEVRNKLISAYNDISRMQV